MSYRCPCCGYFGLNAPAYANLPPMTIVRRGKTPYSAAWGMPSYEVCPCCGFEFGNDDEPGTGVAQDFEEFLAEWMANGQKWFDPSRRPSGWTLARQLSDPPTAIK